MIDGPAPTESPAAADGLRLNLGCGTNKWVDYLNVDKFAVCEPDLVLDLEQFPWPWETSSVREVRLNHVLEHIGHAPATFLAFMVELYRVCRHDAEIHIAVPHPYHDDFIGDPTHVRAITPTLLRLFSKRENENARKNKYANSQLATYTNTDFELIDIIITLDSRWQKKHDDGEITREEVFQLARERLNVAREYRFKLKVVKEAP